MGATGRTDSTPRQSAEPPPGLAAAARLWQSGDIPGALRELRRQITSNPAVAQLRVVQAAMIGQSDFLAARTAFVRATHIAPGEGNVWRDYGVFLLSMGDPQQGCAALSRAYLCGVREPRVLIGIARHLTDARVVLILPDGRRLTALQLLDELFTAQPKLRQEYHDDFIRAITVGPYVRGDGVTAARLCAAFENGAVRRIKLTGYALAFLKDSPAWSTLDELKPAGLDRRGVIAILRRLSRQEVLLTILEAVAIPDTELEERLVVLRRILLDLAADRGERDPSAQRLARAVAIQCTLNEYVFEANPTESERLATLIEETKSDLGAGRRPRDLAISMIAAYAPLAEALPGLYASQRDLANAQDKLAQLHIIQPSTEARLMQTLPVLTPIADSTSGIVRSQYESSPYPTWSAAHTRFERGFARDVCQSALNFDPLSAFNVDPLWVCESGRGRCAEPLRSAAHR
ncbi:MAG: hypothetical protein FJX54_20495, partial [Alphaproteobacteria bacterium]|nr:hypothetical protein [Alphaproteobacteria bacterium]